MLTAVQVVQDKSQQRLTKTPVVQDKSQQRLTQVQVVQHFPVIVFGQVQNVLRFVFSAYAVPVLNGFETNRNDTSENNAYLCR